MVPDIGELINFNLVLVRAVLEETFDPFAIGRRKHGPGAFGSVRPEHDVDCVLMAEWAGLFPAAFADIPSMVDAKLGQKGELVRAGHGGLMS